MKGFEVKQRKDGVWCIYLRAFNVVVAEFLPNTTGSREEISRILFEAFHPAKKPAEREEA